MPRIFDGQGRPLQLTDDGLWVAGTFHAFRPLFALFGERAPIVEPIHYQLSIGETAADGDAALAEIRARYGLS